jgi:hypothetical protein
MKENTTIFNRDQQDPDWKEAVKLWNSKYANGKTIFYKVFFVLFCTILQTASLLPLLAWGASIIISPGLASQLEQIQFKGTKSSCSCIN